MEGYNTTDIIGHGSKWEYLFDRGIFIVIIQMIEL